MNYSVLLASVLVSAAILLNGHLDRRHRAPVDDRPTPQEIEESARQSFELAFSSPGPHVVLGRPREYKDVVIKKVQFNADNRKARVEFLLNFKDGDAARSSYILSRDEFGDYAGNWRDGDESVAFVVKGTEGAL